MLHGSLTPDGLVSVPLIFGSINRKDVLYSTLDKFFVVDNSQDEFDFDVESAQRLYEECFVPLLYHELWESMRQVASSMSREVLFSTSSGIEIQITRYLPQVIDADQSAWILH